MLQLGVMSKDARGNFHPEADMTVGEYTRAIGRLMELDASLFSGYADGKLTREIMAAILHDAYRAKFKEKPKYMTDYNGKTITPDDPRYDPNLDSASRGAMYYPLVSYEQLLDTQDIAPSLVGKVKDAYDLGLIRSEEGIARGRMRNGRRLQPKQIVSRAKAAKTLYFMWVLIHPVHMENHVGDIRSHSNDGTAKASPVDDK
mgnify:CR=1 FL=1